MVNALTVDFDPANFENPSMQQAYSFLQSLALQEKTVQKHEDTIVPDVEGMNKVRPLVMHFRQSVFGDDYVDPERREDNLENVGKRQAKPPNGDDGEIVEKRKGKKAMPPATDDVIDAKRAKVEAPISSVKAKSNGHSAVDQETGHEGVKKSSARSKVRGKKMDTESGSIAESAQTSNVGESQSQYTNTIEQVQDLLEKGQARTLKVNELV